MYSIKSIAFVIVSLQLIGFCTAAFDPEDFGKECDSRANCCQSLTADCPLLCIDDVCAGPVCEESSDCELDWLETEAKCSDGNCVPNSKKSKLWLLGMSLFLFAIVLNNLGMQIQKLAFTREDDRVEALYLAEKLQDAEEYHPKSPLILPLWWAGFLTMISGALLQLVALTFAAQSLLAPLAAFNLVLNMVFAPLILKEIPNMMDIGITLFITAGCTIAVAGGDHSEKRFTPDEIIGRWSEYRFLAYMCGCSCGLILGIITAAWGRAFQLDIEGQKTKKAPINRPLASPHHPSFELRHHEAKFIHQEMEEKLIGKDGQQMDLIHSVADIDNSAAYGFGEVHVDQTEVYLKQYVVLRAYIAGHSGGNSMLFSKMALESFKTHGFEALTHFAFYNFLMALAFAVVIQMYFLNTALKMFDGLFVVPVYAAFFILFSVVNGFLFFEEYNAFTTFNWICFPTGVACTIVGVLALSVQYTPTDNDEQDEQDKEISMEIDIQKTHDKEHDSTSIVI